ncbi:MAG: amidase [Rhodospirillales bacterium]|nr:amidase [Rhodospirillales bacterium]MBO6786597.1 amidase [Rhodospirillales bacterium]
MKDTVNAFIEQFTIPGADAGPLKGMTFGAKDLYDVEGRVTGCGSPDWARTHGPAESTAPAVQVLMDAGATLVGKTHTDEIAYSLMGVNAHYGTPVNSAAPDRVPGGSSSGSVAATAAGLVDFALGSDTGGSVRMPASFSGVYGIRTTHGRIGLSGVMPLAPSFDTAGWFARDPATFAAVGEACGIEMPNETADTRVLIADDAMSLAGAETRAELQVPIHKLIDAIGAPKHTDIVDTSFGEWRETFRVCQAAEAWAAHADWIKAVHPAFGPGVKERFEMAAAITTDQLSAATTRRSDIRKRLTQTLGDDGILVLPTGPGPAPRLDEDEAGLDGFRMAALELLCIAGLCGLPQINIPAGTVDGGPVGLSVIAGHGKDGLLLKMAGIFG